MNGMTLGHDMRRVPRELWPPMSGMECVPLDVWRSTDYLAVLYEQRIDGRRRLSVNSVKRNSRGLWRDGITWDELQRVKNECLGDDVWCVEVYPAQEKLVNVSNIRHLWVLDGPPETRFPEERVVSDADAKKALDLLRSVFDGSE